MSDQKLDATGPALRGNAQPTTRRQKSVIDQLERRLRFAETEQRRVRFWIHLLLGVLVTSPLLILALMAWLAVSYYPSLFEAVRSGKLSMQATVLVPFTAPFIAIVTAMCTSMGILLKLFGVLPDYLRQIVQIEKQISAIRLLHVCGGDVEQNKMVSLVVSILCGEQVIKSAVLIEQLAEAPLVEPQKKQATQTT